MSDMDDNHWWGERLEAWAHEGFNIDSAQIKALTTRQNGHPHFADFRRCKNKFHMGWRLFQRLQQRVKRIARQHVNFVNNVDFITG